MLAFLGLLCQASAQSAGGTGPASVFTGPTGAYFGMRDLLAYWITLTPTSDFEGTMIINFATTIRIVTTQPLFYDVVPTGNGDFQLLGPTLQPGFLVLSDSDGDGTADVDFTLTLSSDFSKLTVESVPQPGSIATQIPTIVNDLIVGPAGMFEARFNLALLFEEIYTLSFFDDTREMQILRRFSGDADDQVSRRIPYDVDPFSKTLSGFDTHPDFVYFMEGALQGTIQSSTITYTFVPMRVTWDVTFISPSEGIQTMSLFMNPTYVTTDATPLPTGVLPGTPFIPNIGIPTGIPAIGGGLPPSQGGGGPVIPFPPAVSSACGSELCQTENPLSYCKTWQSPAVCQGTNTRCGCGPGGVPPPPQTSPTGGLLCDDFCADQVGEGSYCKYYNSPSLCQGTTNVLCSCPGV